MSKLKTLLCSSALLVALTTLATTPASARGVEDDPVKLFATCAGRLSALMEHQWMFDGPASEETKLLAAATVDLLNAVVSAEQTTQAMAWRVEAKVAQRGLLVQAAHKMNPRLSESAAKRADALLRPCRSLLLGQ